MNQPDLKLQQKRRPLWPWVVGAIVLCLFAAGFSFWWPMYRANQVIATIQERGGGVNHTEPSSVWKTVFGDRIHPWFHDIREVHAGPVLVRFREPLNDKQVLALTRFRGVDSLILDISQTSDEVIRELKAFDSLEFLQLIGDDRPVPLEWVQELPKLNHLRLTRVRVTEDCWLAVAELSVPSVSLNECTIGTTPPISGSLKSLTLDRVGLTKDVGKALHDLPLTFLTVRECDSSPEFWQALCGHPTLKFLAIANTELTELDLEGISELVALQDLVLIPNASSSLQLEQRHLQLLGNLNNLQRLRLDGVDVPDDNSWSAVAQISGLRILEINKCPIGDVAIAELVNSPSLEFLWLHETEITDTGLMKLVKLPTLERISISGSTGITDGGGTDFNIARPDVELEW